MNDLNIIIAIIGIIITIIIYNLQFYKNTTINFKKKNIICNILITFFVVVIFYIIFIPKIRLHFKNKDNHIIQNKGNDWEYI